MLASAFLVLTAGALFVLSAVQRRTRRGAA
jgi:hypothetical protein